MVLVEDEKLQMLAAVVALLHRLVEAGRPGSLGHAKDAPTL